MTVLRVALLVVLLYPSNQFLIQREASDTPSPYTFYNYAPVVYPAIPRSLYENLTESFLLGENDSTSGDMNQLNMLIEEENARGDYKKIGRWLTDFEGKIDGMRNVVTRKMTDMAIGLQRKNQIMYTEYKQEVEASNIPAANSMLMAPQQPYVTRPIIQEQAVPAA